MRNKMLFLISILLISTLLTSCAGTALAQSAQSARLATPTATATPPVTRTLSVNGTGWVYLTPDIAYIGIGVHTENKNAAEAVASNNSQSEQVIAAIKKFGVDEKDIQTSNFSINPQQQYDPQGKATGEITYIVDNTVNVTARDLKQLGELLDAAMQAGANSISGIQFDVADKSAAFSQARKMAVEKAQATAQELVEAAGVTLGAVQDISYDSGDVPVPAYMNVSGGAATVEKAAAVLVSAGQMIVSVEVTIVYEIR